MSSAVYLAGGFYDTFSQLPLAFSRSMPCPRNLPSLTHPCPIYWVLEFAALGHEVRGA